MAEVAKKVNGADAQNLHSLLSSPARDFLVRNDGARVTCLRKNRFLSLQLINVRLRKEYLYMKNLEGAERREYEKKLKIREALQEGKPIPTELRNDEAKLRQEIDLEDQNTAGE